MRQPVLHQLRISIAWLVLAALCACGPVQPKLEPRVNFVTLSGQAFGPAQYLGKPLYVNFWSTTCSACLKEMPELVKLHQTLKDRNLQMIAVAMPYDMPSAVVELSALKQWPFAVAIDPQSLAVKAFGNVEQTPSHFLLNDAGRVVWRAQGELRLEDLENALRTNGLAGDGRAS
jgi:thiol-disulfide isomerase/thioredoxin